MAGMANAVSNVNVNEQAGSTSTFHSSAVGGGGGLGIDLGFFSIGGSASGSSYDSKATHAFAHSLSQHADSSSRNMEVATRAASSTTIGEVSTRTHSEGDSEDQYESSSRTFVNPNRCHALTYLFYKLNKCQILKWELIGIDRIVLDPNAPTDVAAEQPAAVERRHRHPGRDPRHERQAAERPADRDGVARIRAVQPAPVQRRPLHGSSRQPRR